MNDKPGVIAVQIVTRRPHQFAVLVAAGLVLCACSGGPNTATPRGAAAVDGARIAAADREPGNWLTYGRTYDEQRFSPLQQIDASNVKQLGLAWAFDLPTAHRGQEATPLVIDGVMYVSGAWSKVFALDARTGALKWAYDPEVPGAAAVNACCDVVNRGVAAWNGKVFVGTLDGRLVALDAASGKPIWVVNTLPPGSRGTITGAPRVVKGKVLIGNGGAEMGVRGYLSAYDAETGKLVWRVYTVPGDPSQPFESPALEKAARTWSGEWWKFGGGGTVWDSIVYDPKLDLVYFGVGNGTPWASRKEVRCRQWRQAVPVLDPRGKGRYRRVRLALPDHAARSVGLRRNSAPDAWPTSSIDGRTRAVIMQAPKNGFFYVLDRATGELLAADPYTITNWAKSIDMQTGRPIVEAAADYGATGKPFLAMPGPAGGHSWQPMAFSPLTGLVYVPVMDAGVPVHSRGGCQAAELGWNIGVDFNAGSLPQDPKVKAQIKAGLKGHLAAWDPVARKEDLACGIRSSRRTAACSRRPVIWCSRATRMASSWPTGPTRRAALVLAHAGGSTGAAHHLRGGRRAVRGNRGGLGRRLWTGRRRARARQPHRREPAARAGLQAQWHGQPATAPGGCAGCAQSAARSGIGGDRGQRQAVVSQLLRHLPWRQCDQRWCASGPALFQRVERCSVVEPDGAGWRA